MKKICFLIVTTMFAISSCAQKEEQTITEQDWAETTFLRYDFTDSSTPPDCHRSYYIGIDKDSIRVRVTSYGDLLLRVVYPSSQEILDKAKATLAQQGIKSVKPKDEPLVCGGTTDALAFFKGDDDKPYFSASIYGGVGTLFVEKGRPESAFLQALPVSIESIIERTRGEIEPPLDGPGMVKPEAGERQPSFPGGETALNEFLAKEMAKVSVDKKMQGTVVVDFVVDDEGGISDAWVSKSNKNRLLEEIALDLFKNMPRWRPGTRDGKPVAMMHQLPIKMKLEPKK
ncbi:MAG: TonB family protein [Bacteroidaceae bacterium]|nr:TonB family protein [Bacteroidaceae bacterium]